MTVLICIYAAALAKWTALLTTIRKGGRKIKQEVPQGAVLSPLLFNSYISKLPPPPELVSLSSHSDNCTILSFGQDIDDLYSKANCYPANLSHIFNARQLKMQPAKFSATLFTSWRKEYRLEIVVWRSMTINNPKILEVTLDSLHFFPPPTTATAATLQSRSKRLKALARRRKNKEILLATYKVFHRPVVN